ncbi:MAG: NAD(P)H-hydrate dehydratase [Clostridia bacterium]|nr:NAD(P)H-hydrate dehydratase [Clostridia bacterium]MDR3645422.1 NAD(P)H-hydrate dehydratase [Clostridia bacterium]
MKIITCEQMKLAESAAVEYGISTMRLMENAGAAAARFIRDTVAVSGAEITVLCGRGNNGGDGFVAARKLMENGARVSVVLACGVPASPEATEMLERLRDLDLSIVDYTAEPQQCLKLIASSDHIVDAVFGTGFHGVIEGPLEALFEAVRAGSAKIFAIDMPSGANADTGEVTANCIRADYTITFAAPKAGQFTFPAAEFCGYIKTMDIGIPEAAIEGFKNPVEMLEQKMIKSALPVRLRDSSKANYGRLLCLCGSLGFSGAAYLSASGALRCGAGLVSLAVPEPIYTLTASRLAEAIVFPAEATETGSFAYANLEKILGVAEKSTALLIGCGLSQNEETLRLVRELVAAVSIPVVLDADGINAFAGHIDLLRESKAPLLLTPHMGEMARLIGQTSAYVKNNRLSTATNLAGETGATVVLKGAYTIIATPRGGAFINPTGNPGMAKGGSGDILAGMAASLCAQGISTDAAACCAAYLHGLAGDRCAERLSQTAMLPSDMLLELPTIFRDLSR